MNIKRDKTDILFSKLIRERDDHTCQRCGNQPNPGGLHCSHFWGRKNRATRWSPENCDALCHGCHSHYESRKAGEYRDWMLGRLGEKHYQELQNRAYSNVKCGKYEKELIHKHMLKNGLDGLEEYIQEVLK